MRKPLKKFPASSLAAENFKLAITGGIATVTLNRPERKNPLTFDSYFELTQFFQKLQYVEEVKAVVIRGAGGNFSSGGDVHEIIGPLTKMDMSGLLDFTRMTGDLVLAMRRCPQPIISAIEGVCAGAGAIISMSSDLRVGAESSKVAFLFVRVGLGGCDMGACAILPRIIGHGRASELLYTGRAMTAAQGMEYGFLTRLVPDGRANEEAMLLASEIVAGPSFAHALTKRMLHQEWNLSIDQAIESEAQAQAIAMQTEDFRIAYQAFASKQKPVFVGR